MNNWQRLALGVIEQAVEDIEVSSTVYSTDRDRFRYKREAYYFFHSDWYGDLAEFIGMSRSDLPPVVERTAASQFGVEMPIA